MKYFNNRYYTIVLFIYLASRLFSKTHSVFSFLRISKPCCSTGDRWRHPPSGTALGLGRRSARKWHRAPYPSWYQPAVGPQHRSKNLNRWWPWAGRGIQSRSGSWAYRGVPWTGRASESSRYRRLNGYHPRISRWNLLASHQRSSSMQPHTALRSFCFQPLQEFIWN